MGDRERAREMLAAEYEVVGMTDAAHYTIADRGMPYSNHTEPALRAIEKALAATGRDAVVEALRAWDAWEAKVLLNDECWTADSGFQVRGALYDEYIEVQSLRTAALKSSQPGGER